MYNQHVSVKYAQAVVRQLGVYKVTEETVYLVSALVDTILIKTVTGAFNDKHDITLAFKAIYDLFPLPYSKDLIKHANQAAEEVSLQESTILANHFMGNPNKSNYSTKIPFSSKGSKHYKGLNVEDSDFTSLLRERCATYTSMGGKLIGTRPGKKFSELSTNHANSLDRLAIFLNEAMEYVTRHLLRGAVIQSQKALSPVIEESHLVDFGNNDTMCASLFQNVSMKDFYVLVRANSSTKDDSSQHLSSTTNKGHRSQNPSAYSFDSSTPRHSDDLLGRTIPLSKSKSSVTNVAKKLYTILGRNKSTYPSTHIPLVTFHDPSGLTRTTSLSILPQSAHSSLDLGPRSDYEQYTGVELVSEPAPPPFIILDNDDFNASPPPPFQATNADKPPDFETLISSGKTVKMFISRANRNLT